MKSIRNIVFLSAVLAALFFIFPEKQTADSIAVSQSPTEYSREGLHALAFIQPETAHHVVSVAKSLVFTARLTAFSDFDLGNSAPLKLRKNFLLQDVDRCQSVSLLLFPHHFFW